MQYQDFSYMRSLPQPTPGSDQSSEVDSRYSPHLHSTGIVTPLPQYTEHQTYHVMAPLSHIPQLPQLPHYSQSTSLVYPYEKSSERPGWLTEVSWGNPPLTNVAVHGR
jgi:hypothetical protein